MFVHSEGSRCVSCSIWFDSGAETVIPLLFIYFLMIVELKIIKLKQQRGNNAIFSPQIWQVQ